MARYDDVPLRAVLRGLVVDRVDFVGAGANGEADIVLFKRHRGAPSTDPIREETSMDTLEQLQAAIDEAVAKAVADAEAKAAADRDEFVAALDALAKADAGTEGDDAEDVTKGLDPAVAEVVKAERAARVALEAEVAKMRDAESERVFKARAATLAHVGEQAEVAAVLKGVAGYDADLAGRLDALLTTVEDRLAASDLLKAQGGRGSDATGPQARFESVIAANQAAGLEYADAVAKAVKDDPDLYRDVLAEQRAKTVTAAV